MYMRKIFHLTLAVCFFITSFPAVPMARQGDAAQLGKNVRTAVQDSEDARQAKLRKEYALLKEQFEKAKDPQEIARLRNKMAQTSQYLQEMEAAEQAHDEAIAKVSAETPDALRIDTTGLPQREQLKSSPENNLLQRIGNNEVTFADLIEYADPLEDPNVPSEKRIPNDLRVIVYAAEIIGNTLDNASKDLPEEILENVNTVLLRAQPRLLFQLYKLEGKRYTVSHHSSDPARDEQMERIMAIGTLRITLLKIQRYYERIGAPNPVRFEKPRTQDKQIQAPIPLEASRGPVITILPPAYSFGDPQKKLNYDPYQHIFETIMQELQGYRHAGTKEGSKEFGHLLIAAEYATFYTLLYDPSQLKQIVDLFDKEDVINSNFNNFKRPFTAVENTIFTTMFETVRFSPIREGTSEKVLQLFKDFSDPQNYSISTRVFALESASLMFRPFNQDFINGSQTQNRLFVLNNITPDKQDKDYFAHLITTLYCSLKNADRPQYGLDSSEMEELSNKLASMYDNIYDISSKLAVFHMPGTDAFTEHPKTACEITMTGNFNKRVRTAEIAEGVLLFVGECVLWTYVGGPLFAALGNAFRATRGAVAVLPRATRAASGAGWGSKWSAFTTVIRNGAKGSNLVENAAKNGIKIVEMVTAPPKKGATAVVAKTGVAAGAEGTTAVAITENTLPAIAHAGGGSSSVPQALVLRPVQHTRQLLGKPNYFSLDNLLGRKIPAPVGTYAVKTFPDGSTAYFKWMGDSFRNMSYDELSLSRFISLDPSKRTLSANLSFFDQKTVSSLTRGQNIIRLGARNGAFDAYIPLQNGKFWNLSLGTPVAEDIGLSVANQTVYLLPRKSFPVLSTSKLRVGKLLTAQQLTEAGAIETSLPEIVNGKWVNTAFHHYFQPVDWGSDVANLLMPRFILTEAGASAFLNPSFAAPMLASRTLLSPLFSTGVFFGALKGIDYGVGYPLQRQVVGNMIKNDMEEIRATHPVLAESMKEQSNDLAVIVPDQSMAKPSVYKSVVRAKRPRKDGASLLLPIVLARRFAAKQLGLGSFNTINDQMRVSFDRKEVMAPYTKALREQKKQIKEQQQKAKIAFEKEKPEFEATLQELENGFYKRAWVQQMLEVDPSVKPKVEQALAEYKSTMLTLFERSDLTAAQRRKGADEAKKIFNQKVSLLKEITDEKLLQEDYEARIALYNANADFNNNQAAYDRLWLNVMLGYQEDFMQKNPNLAKYPDLSDQVRKALDQFLKEKKALFGKSEEIDKVEQQGVDLRLVETLEAAHKLYLEREGDTDTEETDTQQAY